MNTRGDLDAILDAVGAARCLVVTTHVRPDGDAVGSALALARLAGALGAGRVACVMEDPVPAAYRWLPGAEGLRSPRESEPFPDTFVVIDASRRFRVGTAANLIGPETRLVVVDHHVENQPEGDVIFVDTTYAASGEIVAELFFRAGLPMDVETAQCLYVAILTDTGGFRYANTNPRTHRITARLLETGINAAAISARVFDSMTYAKFLLMKRILNRIQLCEDGRVAYAELLPSDLDETCAKAEDLDNLITYGRSIDGVQVAILFQVLDAKTTKISLRSTPEFDSTQVAEFFGGGGHPGAAAAVLSSPVSDARAAVLERVKTCLTKTR